LKDLVFKKKRVLFNRKSTPDFIWLEWEKSADVQLSDIKSYNLIINGETKVVFTSKVNKFVVNDGEIGEQYIFQLKVRLCRR
jgi:hypothetical protein